MDSITKKSLYSDDAYQECLSRIGNLTEETHPQWGVMTAAQMLSHCAEIIEVSNGKGLENTPLIARLFKGMIRKMVVGDEPYPKNAKTHPQYEQKADRDFEEEMERLLAALAQFRSLKGVPIVHRLFGTLSEEEKGWAAFKHLDHHLGQFGV